MILASLGRLKGFSRYFNGAAFSLVSIYSLYLILAVFIAIIHYSYTMPAKDLLRIYTDLMSGDQINPLPYIFTPQNGHFAPSLLSLIIVEARSFFGPNDLLNGLSTLLTFATIGIAWRLVRSFRSKDDWLGTLAIVSTIGVVLLFPQRGDDLQWGLKLHDSITYSAFFATILVVCQGFKRGTLDSSVNLFLIPVLIVFTCTGVAGGVFFAVSALVLGFLLQPKSRSLWAAVPIIICVVLIVVAQNSGMVPHGAEASITDTLSRAVLSVLGFTGAFPAQLFESQGGLVEMWPTRVAIGLIAGCFVTFNAGYVYYQIRVKKSRGDFAILLGVGVQISMAPALYFAAISVREGPIEVLTAYPRFIVWGTVLWIGVLIQMTAWLSRVGNTAIALALICVICVFPRSYAIGISEMRFRSAAMEPRNLSIIAISRHDFTEEFRRIMRARSPEAITATMDVLFADDISYGWLRMHGRSAVANELIVPAPPQCQARGTVTPNGQSQLLDRARIRVTCGQLINGILLITPEGEVLGGGLRPSGVVGANPTFAQALRVALNEGGPVCDPVCGMNYDIILGRAQSGPLSIIGQGPNGELMLIGELALTVG